MATRHMRTVKRVAQAAGWAREGRRLVGEREVSRGGPAGSTAQHAHSQRLAGRCIAIKDNFMLWGSKTTCSSRMLEDFDSPYTATSVQLLLDAGATITEKTPMDEFGMGSNTTHLPPGHSPVINPFVPRSHSHSATSPPPARSAGGSSGGSAVAVASGSAFAALGTDTGGSVRLPASYTGIVGFKPSYGMVSRHGVVAYADSLDCVGVLARRVRDVRDVYDAIARPCTRDSTCVSASIRSRADALLAAHAPDLSANLSSLRIGIPIEASLPADLTPTPLAPLLRHLAERGATLLPVSLPAMRLALPAYYVLACAEASSNLARYGGGWYSGAKSGLKGMSREQTRSEGFGEEVRKRILAGTYALTADAFNNSYLKALHLRQQLRSEFNDVFRMPHPLARLGGELDSPSLPKSAPPDGVDVILHLTATSTAPLLADVAAREAADDGSAASAYSQDILTVPASLAGLPALSMPIGLGADGYPVGLSLVGQWGSDRGLLAIAQAGIEEFGRRAVHAS